MRSFMSFFDTLRIQGNFLTHRAPVLAFLVVNLTDRCNSRCLCCGYWQKESPAELSLSDIEGLVAASRALHVGTLVLSGGEPTLHPEFENIVQLLQRERFSLQLVTNGMLLAQYARLIARAFKKVYVSLDSSLPQTYARIRGVDALEGVSQGVVSLRRQNADMFIIGRTIVQKANYQEIPRIVEYAQGLGMSGIYFSPADMSAGGFGWSQAPDASQLREVLPGEDDLVQLRRVLETAASHPALHRRKFIIDSPRRLVYIHNYYAAGLAKTRARRSYCSLPWLSAVVTAEGEVRPCHFLGGLGNIRKESLIRIADSKTARDFRKGLKAKGNARCGQCVFSRLRLRWGRLNESLTGKSV